MCVVDSKELTVLKGGVLIDAPFPRNMELAYEMLIRTGYNKKKDFLYVSTQCESHFSTLSYIKTLKWNDESEEIYGHHYSLVVPDRYIPSKDTQENVIRTEDDIDKLFDSMSKKEES